MTFEIDVERGLVWVKGTPELTLEDLTAVVRGVLAHPDHTPGMKAIWDLRGSDLARLSSTDLQNIHEFNSISTKDMPPRRSAIVVDRTVSFGIGRMYEMLSEGGKVSTRIFMGISEAEGWVLEKD